MIIRIEVRRFVEGGVAEAEATVEQWNAENRETEVVHRFTFAMLWEQVLRALAEPPAIHEDSAQNRNKIAQLVARYISSEACGGVAFEPGVALHYFDISTYLCFPEHFSSSGLWEKDIDSPWKQ